MNYFSHAIRFLDRPWFALATGIPDWVSVVDRSCRLREKNLIAWDGIRPHEQAILDGIRQHLHDDDWFHTTRGFAEITDEIAVQFRKVLPPDERYSCGFLGHLVTELLLDATLIEQSSEKLQAYYELFREVDVAEFQTVVNRVATRPTQHLTFFVEQYRHERFLEDYASNERLRHRLNQVMRRVKLAMLPETIDDVLSSSRELIRIRWRELLPQEHFNSLLKNPLAQIHSM